MKYFLRCLLCKFTQDDLETTERGVLAHMQEHAMQKHGITLEQLRANTHKEVREVRSMKLREVSITPDGLEPGYEVTNFVVKHVYTLPSGKDWLEAIPDQPEQQ